MVTLAQLQSKQEKVAVVGLGYVGLPLAVALAKHFSVVGFDINEKRIAELTAGHDHTREVPEPLLKSVSIEYSAQPQVLKNCKFIIVAVPTPVHEDTLPDLSLVEKATALVGKNLSAGTIISYESTVYPGVTDDICVPILAKESGLTAHQDFKVAYSPERINPGDREHTIDKVVKVVSSEDEASLEVVDGVYGAITKTFKASSIKVAEAAKVIENTQRDVNIALMNELALVFDKLGISTYDVLAAAGTKWNFLPFKPGLVGGHCIGVDPYYLTYRAQQLGYKPEVILSGRRINDAMGEWIADKLCDKLEAGGTNLKGATALVCGITFKENIPDVRNSKVALVVEALKKKGLHVQVIDPEADPAEVEREYGLTLTSEADLKPSDLVVMAVAHKKYAQRAASDWAKVAKSKALFGDVKGLFSKKDIEAAGLVYWTI
jgi:UDP-N-acetyl-D-galactosamine dehydrogenase